MDIGILRFPNYKPIHILCGKTLCPITADSPYSVDIFHMVGSSRVLQLYDILGRSLLISPDRQIPIKEGTELILIGTYDGQRRFLQSFVS